MDDIIQSLIGAIPYPSCPILGMAINGKYLHVVVSHDEAFIYLITAYYPDPQLWEPDFKARRERSK